MPETNDLSYRAAALAAAGSSRPERELIKLIEQALLAERRLAMEAMEQAANELFGGTVGPSIRRAAAEKEVGK